LTGAILTKPLLSASVADKSEGLSGDSCLRTYKLSIPVANVTTLRAR